MLNERNHALGFAERTRKNLAYIEAAFSSGADVHVVTQLANSLLGLIALPVERDLARPFRDLQLNELIKQGWPRWVINRGDCQTLEELLRHLRNAVAHGHMLFSSDSRLLEKVAIEFADFKRGAVEAHWVARIQGPGLRDFSLSFSRLIEDVLG
jgi:hypothetical protein